MNNVELKIIVDKFNRILKGALLKLDEDQMHSFMEILNKKIELLCRK